MLPICKFLETANWSHLQRAVLEVVITSDEVAESKRKSIEIGTIFAFNSNSDDCGVK